MRLLAMLTWLLAAAEALRSQVKPPHIEKRHERVKRFTGGATLPGGDLSKVPYMSLVYYMTDRSNPATFVDMSSGVAVNKYWVLTLVFDVLDKMANIDFFRVRVGSYDPATLSGGVDRPVREVVYDEANYAATSKFVNCLALLRVCPSLPSSSYRVTLAPALAPYRDPASQVNLYNYLQGTPPSKLPLHKATKQVGEKCECSDTHGFDSRQHFCLASDPVVHVSVPDELDQAVVITSADDSEFAGFVVSGEAEGSELVLWVNFYLAWIQASSPTAPYY